MSYVTQDFPAPIKPATVCDFADIPPTVRKHLIMATEAAWTAHVTEAVGFMPDTATGEPKRKMYKHVFDNDAENPNGKQYEFRDTGELITVNSFALRAFKDDEQLAAVWHFTKDKVSKRPSDSAKTKKYEAGERWKKGDEVIADECSFDMGMLKSGKRFRNVTELGAYLSS